MRQHTVLKARVHDKTLQLGCGIVESKNRSIIEGFETLYPHLYYVHN